MLPLLALLAAACLIDLREPQPLPCAAAQRELEEIQASLDPDSEVFPREEMEDFFLEFAKSGDVNTRSDRWEWSMLHLACWYKKPALAQYLLQAGADADAVTKSRQGWTASQPFSLALDAYLHQRTEANRRMVELLLAHGVDVNCRASQHTNSHPLADCTSHEDAEDVFLLLLEHGADVNSASHTPYTYACAYLGWETALTRLLELGAPQEDLGDYALHGAASCAWRPGTLECARLLLEAGADVERRDESWGRNALMWLVNSAGKADPPPDAGGIARMGQMVQLFRQYGAKLDEPWCLPEEEMTLLRDSERAMERRRAGRPLAEVLREEQPELAAWLVAQGVPLP